MLAMVKHCARMEALCAQLARRDPDNRAHWQAEAQSWHQRAGRYVTEAFGDVDLISSENDEAQTRRTAR